MHSIWSPLTSCCGAEGCVPQETRTLQPASHTCWNASCLSRTTSNCTLHPWRMLISTCRHTVNALMAWSSCSPLLLHQVFHVSLITPDLVIHVIPLLSTRLNLSRVAWGKRADPWTAAPPTLRRVSLCVLHLLPSLFNNKLRGFSQTPKPQWEHPHRVLTRAHHSSPTPARSCSACRGCLTPPAAPA